LPVFKSNRAKVLFGWSIALAVICYIYLVTNAPSNDSPSSQEAVTETTTEDTSQGANQSLTLLSDTISSQPNMLEDVNENNKVADNNIQADCDSALELSSALEQEYIELVNDVLGFDFTSTLHNEYQIYDEDTLLVLADSGDAKAMIMLGFNYRWYARFESFNTQIFSSHIQQKPKKRKQVNLEYIERSNQWFDQAAYHGLPNALSEKELNYALLIEKNQPDSLINNKQMWNRYSKVIPVLMQWIMPQHNDIMSISQAAELELDPADNQLLSLLKAQWIEQRTQRNLPITIRFNYSSELAAVLDHISHCSQRSAD
jgi:hypothetical protein